MAWKRIGLHSGDQKWVFGGGVVHLVFAWHSHHAHSALLTSYPRFSALIGMQLARLQVK